MIEDLMHVHGSYMYETGMAMLSAFNGESTPLFDYNEVWEKNFTRLLNKYENGYDTPRLVGNTFTHLYIII